jgi:hypothetical protein
VCVDADLVAPIPAGMSTSQAAVMGGVGMTALRGLQDVLEVRGGESLLVRSASDGRLRGDASFRISLSHKGVRDRDGVDAHAPVVTRMGTRSCTRP